MSFLSNCIAQIMPSATLAMTQKAKEMRAAGKDILNLAGGEPDFPTVAVAREAGKSAIDRGHIKYTAVDGTPELKQAIIDKFIRDNGLQFAPEQIIVSVGAKQSIFNALMATINPGDEVIIPAPYWVSYPDMVRLAGGMPVIVKCGLDNNLKMTSEQLAKAITVRTKWLIINSPSNPSGTVYGESELKALGDVIAKHSNVHVLSDDIYEHILFDEQKFHTMASVCPDISDRVLTVNGVSKAYAMTGWRVGYAGGAASLIGAMKKIQSQSTSNPSAIAQAAACAALQADQTFLQDWRQSYQQRRDLMLEKLNNIEGIKCLVPQGAFYLFINCESVISNSELKDDVELATYLLKNQGVATVPGTAFGMSSYLRLSFAADEKELIEGCERIKSAVVALRA